MKKFLVWCLVVLYCTGIFHFSAENGAVSSKRSRDVTKKIVRVLDLKDFRTKKILIEKIKHKKTAEYYIRKAAHVSLYFGLAFLIFFAFGHYRGLSFKKRVFFTWLICCLFAMADEYHQLFVTGRDGKVKDVFIDNIGIGAALVLQSIIWQVQKGKK